MRTRMHSSKVDAVNTNRDGTGSAQLLGKLEGIAFLESVTWRPLGDNSACLGMLILNNGNDRTYPANNDVIVTTLPAVSSTSATAKPDPVTTPLGFYLPQGWEIFGAVSVDLTGESGYVPSVVVFSRNPDEAFS